MGQLLQAAASPKSINAAWKRCRGDRAVWKPGLGRAEMERDIGFHLLELSQSLENGTYRPDPVRNFAVQKGDGSRRIISALTLRDKVAQRAVLGQIEAIGEKLFHPDSYAYRPGRTVEMARSRAREHILCGMSWLVDADIQDFFDEIPHRPLLRKISRHLPDKELVALISRWLEAGAAKKGILSAPKGIPQGAVISPWLCNLYLTEWDYQLTRKNLPFVRFADDFLVFNPSLRAAEKTFEFVKKSLGKIHLRLNPKKSRVTRCGPRIRFLGQKLPKPA